MTTHRRRIRLDVVVRPMVKADLEPLEWYGHQREQMDQVRKALAHAGGRLTFLVAELNGFPVGRLGVDRRRRRDGHYLWSFAVIPHLQRLGIGTLLMEAAEAGAVEEGVTVVEVGVDDWNVDARRLYERLGYRVIGTERGVDGEAIIVLSKRVRR